MADFIKPVIYLIKEDVTDATDIFKEDAEGLLVEGTGDASFFYKPSPSNVPKWLGFVTKYYNVNPRRFYNASSYGVNSCFIGGISMNTKAGKQTKSILTTAAIHRLSRNRRCAKRSNQPIKLSAIY